jgi:hypothetical protein
MNENYVLLSAYYTVNNLIINKHTDYGIRKKEHTMPTCSIQVNQNNAVDGRIILAG